jgi:hypothetical protein
VGEGIVVEDYDGNAERIAEKYSLRLSTEFVKHDYYFLGDKEKRNIYKCKLSRKNHQYIFMFGASIAKGNAPTLYDVLSCMQKYPIGSFEEFIAEFGYDENWLSDYPKVKKIYNAVKKEYAGFSALFDGNIPDDIIDIA